MKIGNIEFKNGIFLSPMAGVTDVGFRKICEDFGAEMCVSEMVSAKGIMYNNKNTITLRTQHHPTFKEKHQIAYP